MVQSCGSASCQQVLQLATQMCWLEVRPCFLYLCEWQCQNIIIMPRPRGHFGIAGFHVPWRSCLGYRHAGCLQLSHRRPPEMCRMRTRLRTDVDPPRFLPPSDCCRRGHIVSPLPGDTLLVFLCLSNWIQLYFQQKPPANWLTLTAMWCILFVKILSSVWVCIEYFMHL